MTTVFEVAAQAARWHGKQIRKYTSEPYIQHPLAVAALVEAEGALQKTVMAALLHDVVEDCGVSLRQVADLAGDNVAAMVDVLTDRYTKAAYPALNRAERKVLARDRWVPARWGSALYDPRSDASLVKLADLLDNAVSIKLHDPEFWPVYRAEALALSDVLRHGYPNKLHDVERHNRMRQRLLVVLEEP